MSFLSFSQNFEDVMLWRALKKVENGFYIDVGAHDPVFGSVTKAFYDRGWRGINIEPTAGPFALLQSARQRDVNLQVGAGSCETEMDLYDVYPSGLATLCAGVANEYKNAGHEVVLRRVSIRTLESICREHVKGEIHFLKIDVEGYEREVLLGAKFSTFRPWILVIEATHPNSPRVTHNEWEDIVVSAGYEFVYFDGLNRFYVAKEHNELADHFKVPPNFFDDFALSSTCFLVRDVMEEAGNRERQAIQRAQESEKKARELEVQSKEAYRSAQEMEARLQQVYLSRSWRVTAPFRWLMSQARFAGNRLLSTRNRTVDRLAKPLARTVIIFMQRRPQLWMCGVNTCKAVGAYRVARAFYRRYAHGHIQTTRATVRHSSQVASNVPANLRLSPAEARVFNDLKLRAASVSRRVE